MTQTIRHARCACGAVQVQTRGEPKRSMLCSCADCRRKTGSAFNWTLYWPEADVMVTGATTTFRRAGQGGRGVVCNLCATCGGTVWWRLDALPGEIAIGGGFFDATDLPPPTIAYWTQSRPAWALDLAAIPAEARQ